MSNFVNYILIFLILGLGYHFTKKKMINLKINHKLLSLPSYYGKCVLIYNLIAILLFSLITITNIDFLKNNYLLPLILSFLTIFLIVKIKPSFNARKHYEAFIKFFLWLSTSATILITIVIILSVSWESIKFFMIIPLPDFLFGINWHPQDEVFQGQTHSFGIIPLLLGSFLITLISLIIAIPIGLTSSIFLAEYTPKSVRMTIKPIIEMLAGIPTVVYGYFAANIIGPYIREIGEYYNLTVASGSALAAGLVMGIMIIPFILSLSDDIINAVPQTLRDASFALGSTKSETILKVIIPAALPGIMGAILLAISRAIGETMIVTMAAGLNANLTFNPLNSVTTITAQIVSLLTGDQLFDSPKTLSAFALGLTLFFITLLINFAAILIVNKYKEQYE